nr:MAG TPA: hypothetical protein [Caudoviricetes sp.]
MILQIFYKSKLRKEPLTITKGSFLLYIPISYRTK